MVHGKYKGHKEGELSTPLTPRLYSILNTNGTFIPPLDPNLGPNILKTRTTKEVIRYSPPSSVNGPREYKQE